MTGRAPTTSGKSSPAGGAAMIATDERFWQSPPQNNSCVSLPPESCVDSCWSDDSCEQTATCPASSRYSRHNSFTPIDDVVLITSLPSCPMKKEGRLYGFLGRASTDRCSRLLQRRIPVARNRKRKAQGLLTSPAVGRYRNPRRRSLQPVQPHRRSHRPIPPAKPFPDRGDPGSTLFP